jgi:hypothetical protein
MKKHSARTIQTYQMLTELRLDQLLQEAESSLTIEQAKELIFEAEREHFCSYLTAMLSALNSNVDDIEQAELQVIQDAWNYFPHRCFGGRCPEELFAELTEDN